MRDCPGFGIVDSTVGLNRAMRDFLTRSRSTRLQDRVVRAAQTGAELVVSDIRPDSANNENQIAGELIYEILSGTHGAIHHRGIRLRGVYVEGDINLYHLQWNGPLHLIRCTIAGDIVLDYARPTASIILDDCTAKYVTARNAVINGSVFIRRSALTESGFNGGNLTVKGALNMTGSHFCGVHQKSSTMAVNLYRAQIGDLYLHSVTSEGGLYGNGMIVERNVRVQGSVFRSRTSMGWEHTGADYKGAFSLAGSVVKSTIYIWTTDLRNFAAHGGFDLRNTTCQTLYVAPQVFEETPFDIDGMFYSELQNITCVQLLTVLNESPRTAPRSYIQLAGYCASVGDLTMRRRVLICLEKRLTKAIPLSSPLRWWRSSYGLLVGYGYSAWRAVFWLAMVTLSATVLLRFGSPLFAVKPIAGQRPGTPVELGWSDSLKIVVDSFLPFASIGMKDTWVATPTNWQQWAWATGFLLLRFAAWGLAALALLSFTNVVRNPRT